MIDKLLEDKVLHRQSVQKRLLFKYTVNKNFASKFSCKLLPKFSKQRFMFYIWICQDKLVVSNFCLKLN